MPLHGAVSFAFRSRQHIHSTTKLRWHSDRLWASLMDNPDHQRIILICDCGTLEHQVIMEYWDDEPFAVDISVSMIDNKSFWRRFWTGIKYILGYRGKNDWYYSSTVAGPTDVQRIQDFLKQFQDDNVGQYATDYTKRRRWTSLNLTHGGNYLRKESPT